MVSVTAHPSGMRERRAKGRGKEPEVHRGKAHPAAPWSCSAAGLPRGIALRRVPAPDGWAPWAALLALVSIEQIKQRHSAPAPRGSAAPGAPRRLLKDGPDRAKRQREAPGGSGRCRRSLTAGVVARTRGHTEATAGSPSPGSGISLRVPIATPESHPEVTPVARER